MESLSPGLVLALEVQDDPVEVDLPHGVGVVALVVADLWLRTNGVNTNAGRCKSNEF